MSGSRPACRARLTIAAVSALVLVSGAGAPACGDTLQVETREGLNLNSLTRDGQAAAHLVLRAGRKPRILVVFPAGNSAAALWFEGVTKDIAWILDGVPQPTSLPDPKGRTLNGIVAHACAAAPPMTIRRAILSSTRVVRDYEGRGRVPASVAAAPHPDGAGLTWARDRLDGAPGYRLSVVPTDGAWHGRSLVPGPDGRICVAITALTGERPLAPLDGPALLDSAAAPDADARNALAFLSYREKLLAGSWRFATYFGRDTLMSVRLLMPVLAPQAVEDALASVLARLSDKGEVAHEEGIGEFAVLYHRKHDRRLSDDPVYDYHMIDGDFLLAPVIGRWLLDDPRGNARGAAFLAGTDGRTDRPGEANGQALVRNLRLVVDHARAFAAEPSASRLIALKPHRKAGEWRDSDIGLGGGRYPYDVNAVFVPAALAMADRLRASGLLDPYMTDADRTALATAGDLARIWSERAPPLFAITVDNATARARIAAYAREIGVPDQDALAALGTADLRFNALSLESDGRPVPVIHSDDGFSFLFGNPGPADLRRAAETMLRPFPAGLMTPIGLLVANPVLDTEVWRRRLNRNAYHGTVVWSWQQALLAAGLDRQLARGDLDAATRNALAASRDTVWQGIRAARDIRNSELWSWRFGPDGYVIVPFGAQRGDADESNVAQLWSTVYLAVRPPAEPKGDRPPSKGAEP